jgi:ClpA/ClpB-like protein
MKPRSTKTALIALGGSVALASAAYGIGSATGGGNSGAATAQGAGPARGTRVMWLDREGSLAKRLGVTEARLQAAFDAIRTKEQQSGHDPRSEFENALAGALGVPLSKVQDAFNKLETQHRAAEEARRAAFAGKLASALGLDQAKVKSALDAVRPPDFLDALAGKLGVDPAKLRGALEKVRPAGPMGGPPPFAGPPGEHPGMRFFHKRFGPRRFGPGGPGRFGPGGPPPGAPPGAPRPGRLRFGLRVGPPPMFVDELSKALGVKSSDVRAALEKVRSQLEAQMRARRDRLMTELANQLGIPVQKVKDAFAAEMHSPPWKGP